MTIKIQGDKIIFPDDSEQTTAYDGSSGGGSGTTTATVDTAIGMVAPFAMDSVPTGWLHCDGSAVSRTTYSLLYSKVGDLYGAGDGSTTFNLPDLQDEFIRGSSDTLAVGDKQGDALQGHRHSPSTNAFGYSVNGAGGTPVLSNTSGATANNFLSGPTEFQYGVPRVADETRPRNVAMLYCINATAETSSGGGEATGTPSSFARIVDEKPEETHCGTSNVGTQDRELNKIEYDKDNIVTLNTNEFTLQKGTYVIDYSAPAKRSDRHRASLFSVTDNVTVGRGDSAFNASISLEGSSDTRSTGRYVVTLTSPHTYKVQHFTETAKAWDGLGTGSKNGVGIFTTVDIQKVGTGGASSGDSIWTEVGDVATYDGDIKVNGITVGGHSGEGNTIVGAEAKEGTGVQVTALGSRALKVNNGNYNTAVGHNAMGVATGATYCTAMGVSALANLTTGSRNTAFGLEAGRSLTTGSNNTLIGQSAEPSSPTASNEVVIGNVGVTKTTLRGAVTTNGSFMGYNATLMGSGISYQGASLGGGGANAIAFRWVSPKIVGVVDNFSVIPLVMDSELRDVETAFDKKLAIKDKLIEKLSARLDKLEKKVK